MSDEGRLGSGSQVRDSGASVVRWKREECTRRVGRVRPGGLGGLGHGVLWGRGRWGETTTTRSHQESRGSELWTKSLGKDPAPPLFCLARDVPVTLGFLVNNQKAMHKNTGPEATGLDSGWRPTEGPRLAKEQCTGPCRIVGKIWK